MPLDPEWLARLITEAIDAAFVKVEKELGFTSERLAALEGQFIALPTPKDEDFIRAMVQATTQDLMRASDVKAIVARDLSDAIIALPTPSRGEKGEQGERGLQGERGERGADGPGPTAEQIALAVAEYLAAHPVRDGRDGRDGKDGMNGLNGKDGIDGMNGKDGRDGVGWNDMDEHIEDGGRVLVRRYLLDGAVVKEFRHQTATVIYRNVYRPELTYQRGDQVTWDGSLWHANKETSAKPGSGNGDWTLVAKRGGDGKPGPKGDKGDPGERGPQGPMGPRVY